MTDVDPSDISAVERQLGRRPRAVVGVAHRCACGLPDVVETEPRLSDGTPFPTLFYLTCPRVNSAIGTLEEQGVMRSMQHRLQIDDGLAAEYRRAHEDYLARRRAIAEVPEIETVSAGGMPDRVKCLHVLVAHSLAAGPGINPLGDEALALLVERGLRRWPALRRGPGGRGGRWLAVGWQQLTAAPTPSDCWSRTSTRRPVT